MFHVKSIKAKGFTRLSQLILICGGLVLLAPATAIAAVHCIQDLKENLSSNVRVSHDAPLHTVLKKLQNKITLRCTGIEPNNRFNSINYIYSVTPPDSSGIYSINSKGIGVRYTLNAGSTCSQGGPTIHKSSMSCPSIGPSPNATINLIYDVELIKLDNNHGVGPISGYLDFSLRYWGNNDGISDRTISDIFSPLSGINISRYGCAINTPDLNFNLGKQQQKDFTGIGPIGSGPTQQIALTCDPNTKYSLKVDGDAEPNHSGVIKLTPESGAATGVGVQLHANGQPVEFGKAKEMGQTAASGTDIKENIDITARYYQTAPTVTPGSANASATYTITYQ